MNFWRKKKPMTGGEFIAQSKTVELDEYGFIIEGFLKDNEGVKAIVPFHKLPQTLKEEIIRILKEK